PDAEKCPEGGALWQPFHRRIGARDGSEGKDRLRPVRRDFVGFGEGGGAVGPAPEGTLGGAPCLAQGRAQTRKASRKGFSLGRPLRLRSPSREDFSSPRRAAAGPHAHG